MHTWHTSTLDRVTRSLIHDGLLIEYAPGYVIEADLAKHREFRARAIGKVLSPTYTAIGRTALWIHTGFLYPDFMPRLNAAHPNSSLPCVTSRRIIESDCTQNINGMRVTTPACTAVELLLKETPENAWRGICALYDTHCVSEQEIASHLTKETSRNGSRKARATFSALSRNIDVMQVK